MSQNGKPSKRFLIAAIAVLSVIILLNFLPALAWLSGFYINTTILPLLLAPLALWGVLAFVIKIGKRTAARIGIAAFFGVIAYIALINVTGAAFGYNQDRLMAIAMGIICAILVMLLSIPAILSTNRYFAMAIMITSLLVPPIAGDLIAHLPKDRFVSDR